MKSKYLNIRVDLEEKLKIEKFVNEKRKDFENVSAYVRSLIRRDMKNANLKIKNS